MIASLWESRWCDFFDGRYSEEATKLCCIIGIVLRPVKIGSLFHLLKWSSEKSKNPGGSTAAPEILATGGGTDESADL